MRKLFYFGHPAHFHLFKNCINKRELANTLITIKTKDVLEDLVKSAGFPYCNLTARERRSKGISIYLKSIARTVRLYKIVSEFKPDLLIGCAAEIAWVGRVKKIPILLFFEDDLEAVPHFARFAVPFANTIIAPDCCSAGKWDYKRIQYNSYHELAYLHPNHFTPDRQIFKKYLKENERNFLLRFSSLNAYHDVGIQGITNSLANEIIRILRPYGRVIINSERPLSAELEQYRIFIDPKDMHDLLAYIDLLVGDSQTMTAEAAVLGTPAIRFNDFVGRLGYLEELEHIYELTYGFPTKKVNQLLSKIETIASTSDLRAIWEIKRNKMLKEKIDAAKFLNWLIGSFPESIDTYKNEPLIARKFH